MKNLLNTLLLTLFLVPAFAQTARLQAIHNSADAAAQTVDVWLTTPLGSSKLIDDFTFRTASSFIDAPAGVNITISIAPSTSTLITDTFAGLSFTYNLMANETYVVVADGIVSATGYSPAPTFNLNVYGMGREMASTAGNTDVLVHHGSTDAPMVDVRERTLGATVVDDASYGDFAGYLELATADYILDVQDASGTTTVASFSAPLSTLNLTDSALVIVASGFLDPSMNSTGAGFGLYVALPGGGALIPLPAADAPMARVNIIHNSADMAASMVDVYVNGTLAVDDFSFRTATGFIDLPATAALEVGIAPSTSTSIADTIPGAVFNYNLGIDEKYIIVADGIVSATGYSPAPAFNLNVYDMGREMASMAGNTDVLVHHGSTDAPMVDVRERTLGATVVDDASYGDFAGYLELATADYILDVQDASGTTTVASFSAPLSTLNLTDSALVVVASGFLDPSMNSAGASFGLFVALPGGGNLIPLPAADAPMARVNIIHNSADMAASMVDVYVNGTLAVDDFSFRTATGFIDLPATAALEVGIAPSTSTSVADAIATFNYNLGIDEKYIIVADGIVSATGYSPAQAFDLYVYDMGREMASMAGNTDVLVHHGSTDAPTVDVDEVTAGSLVDDASYGDFAGYLELPTADYTIQVKDETGATVVKTYAAPLSTLNLDGAALTVVASGFLDPSMNSDGAAFGLFAAFANGGELVALPEVNTTSINSINKIDLNVYPNPTNGLLNIEVQEENIVSVQLTDVLGRVVATEKNIENNQLNITSIPTGLYQLVITLENNKVSVSNIQKR